MPATYGQAMSSTAGSGSSSPAAPAAALGHAPRRFGRLADAFAGVVAVGAALASGELLAGLVPGVPAPILAVGRMAIDLRPPGAKEVVVSLFGTADKLALQVFVVVVGLAIGAGLGVLGRTRRGAAMAVIGAVVALGLVAGRPGRGRRAGRRSRPHLPGAPATDETRRAAACRRSPGAARRCRPRPRRSHPDRRTHGGLLPDRHGAQPTAQRPGQPAT